MKEQRQYIGFIFILLIGLYLLWWHGEMQSTGKIAKLEAQVEYLMEKQP